MLLHSSPKDPNILLAPHFRCAMNIGLIRERAPFDRRVALTPPIVRRLAAAGHTIWVESGAGDGAMFLDPDYLRAGAQIAYSPDEVLGRIELLAKIGRP